MRSWMILGGLIGFLIGLSFGIAQGSGWPTVIWRASIAASLSGVALRWWGGVWVRSLQEAHRERLLALNRPAPSTSAAKSRL